KQSFYPTEITLNPASAAASPRRWSAVINGRFRGRPLHHSRAAASWKESNARNPYLPGKSAAIDRTLLLGSITRAPAQKLRQCPNASARPGSLIAFPRKSRASELLISTSVPHHTALFEYFLRSLLATAVAFGW